MLESINNVKKKQHIIQLKILFQSFIDMEQNAYNLLWDPVHEKLKLLGKMDRKILWVSVNKSKVVCIPFLQQINVWKSE